MKEQDMEAQNSDSAPSSSGDAPEARWLPIESAPQGDDRASPVLAVVRGRVRIVKWGKTSHVPMYGFCLADQGVEDFDLCQPTHWMPLPLPPSAGAIPRDAGEQPKTEIAYPTSRDGKDLPPARTGSGE